MRSIWMERCQDADRSTLLGSFLQTSDEAVVELMSSMSFDVLCADGEHGAFSATSLRRVASVCQGSEIPLLVRIPEAEYFHCAQALDAGAAGIIAPRVNDAKRAGSVVEACRYPPEGVRGVGPGRASSYGQALNEYVREAREHTLVGLQIESAQAVSNLEEILLVPGVDLIFIGPNDLAASMTGELNVDSREVVDAIGRVRKQSKKAGHLAGIFAATTHDVERRLEEGFDLIVLASDLMFLSTGASGALDALARRKLA